MLGRGYSSNLSRQLQHEVMAPSDCSDPSNFELDWRHIGRVRSSRCLLEGLVAAVEFEVPAILDLAVCEGTFGRPVSFGLGRSQSTKSNRSRSASPSRTIGRAYRTRPRPVEAAGLARGMMVGGASPHGPPATPLLPRPPRVVWEGEQQLGSKGPFAIAAGALAAATDSMKIRIDRLAHPASAEAKWPTLSDSGGRR